MHQHPDDGCVTMAVADGALVSRPDTSAMVGAAVAQVVESSDRTTTIGSLAIQDSQDVHIGNRTYIHGPITIKQVINGRAPEDSSYDNKGFEDDGVRIEKPDVSGKIFKLLTKKQLIVCGVIIFVTICLATLTLIFLNKSQMTDELPIEDFHKDIPRETKSDVVLSVGNIRPVPRQVWLAQPSERVDKLKTPVPMVIIIHTVTESCKVQSECIFIVRQIQTYHMESRNWSDIGYNFLVGGDGSVYEGRGWDTVGAHTKGFNARSIGIALIGTFNNELPPQRQLEATKRYIEHGVKLNKIAKDYKLFGHRQLTGFLSPGEALFKEIQKWPHFSTSL